MNVSFVVNGRSLTFKECWANPDPDGRGEYQPAILMEDVEDLVGDSDGLFFNCTLPETVEDARIMIENEEVCKDFKTLDSITYKEPKL